MTDPEREDSIPEKDRPAVFGPGGTLCGERFPICFDRMMVVRRVLNDPEDMPM